MTGWLPWQMSPAVLAEGLVEAAADMSAPGGRRRKAFSVPLANGLPHYKAFRLTIPHACLCRV